MAAADTSIAVVVLTHDRVHLLRQCVENVLGQVSPTTREIVIWNNGSTDGTRAYLDAVDDPRITSSTTRRTSGRTPIRVPSR